MSEFKLTFKETEDSIEIEGNMDPRFVLHRAIALAREGKDEEHMVRFALKSALYDPKTEAEAGREWVATAPEEAMGEDIKITNVEEEKDLVALIHHLIEASIRLDKEDGLE